MAVILIPTMAKLYLKCKTIINFKESISIQQSTSLLNSFKKVSKNTPKKSHFRKKKTIVLKICNFYFFVRLFWDIFSTVKCKQCIFRQHKIYIDFWTSSIRNSVNIVHFQKRPKSKKQQKVSSFALENLIPLFAAPKPLQVCKKVPKCIAFYNNKNHFTFFVFLWGFFVVVCTI